MKHKCTMLLSKVFQEKRQGNDISKQPIFSWLRDHTKGDWDWENLPDGHRVLFRFQESGDALMFKLKWGGI